MEIQIFLLHQFPFHAKNQILLNFVVLIFLQDRSCFLLLYLPFGKKQISTVGIISGGANHDVSQAIDEGLDLYITGEIGHDNYHQCLENKINYIAGGHYQTETVGVNLLRKKLEEEKHLETVFIDVPTGL